MSPFSIDVSSLLYGALSEIEVLREVEMPVIEKSSEQILLAKPVKLGMKLSRTGSDIEAAGTIETEAILICSRCLKEFHHPFKIEVVELFFGLDNPADEGDYHIVHDQIDLFPLIEESILLTVPFKPVCDEACKGICSHCGRDQNVDPCDCPREEIHPGLAVLKDLLSKEKGNK